jgi:predicted polyphosphate/ATP-dependent NAD kinase
LKRIGLIVNPYAGIGGRVGLKGSDGAEIRERALELGAVPMSPSRTVDTLKQLTDLEFTLYTYPGEMGEAEAKEAGLSPIVLGELTGDSTAEDTRKAAALMLEQELDLLVFAGGDGTARDIYSVVDEKMPVLGIPTGVKIHSGVYAVDPRGAGELIRRFITGDNVAFRLEEVMDIDEEAFRNNRLQAQLYGYMTTLYTESLIQGGKESSRISDESSVIGIANEICDEMEHGVMYVLGPGTTVKPIADRLNLPKTLLGVDVVKDKQLLHSDVNETQLLEAIKGETTQLIVTVIGGQGFVFGRGNQQISPKVIRTIGLENIIIIATPEKLAALKGHPLRVDTGDPELDEEFKGYYKVHTGYGRRTLYKLA